MNNKIVCIYPIDKTTEFLLPIFERLQKVSSQKMAIDCNLYLRCEQKF